MSRTMQLAMLNDQCLGRQPKQFRILLAAKSQSPMMIFASCSFKSQSGVASNALCLIHPRQKPLDLLLLLTTYLSCTMVTTEPTETLRDVKPGTGSKLETTEPENNGIISHWHAYLVWFIVFKFSFDQLKAKHSLHTNTNTWQKYKGKTGLVNAKSPHSASTNAETCGWTVRFVTNFKKKEANNIAWHGIAQHIAQHTA